MEDAVLRTEQLVKIYGGRQRVRALDGIDLEIASGEIFGLLGPNGAGKTTTVGIWTTRVLPTSGRAFVGRIDVVTDPPLARRSIGLVPQFNTLDRACSAWENLYFHCRYFGFDGQRARRRADELLAEFRLGERATAFPNELSGGMAQRLQLARAIAHYPSVLFLDEPTAGLDPQSRLAVWEMVRDMRRRGTTILLTTHNMEEADQLCDRVAIIDHGKILVCDTPNNLKQRTGAQRVLELHVDGARQSLAEGLGRIPAVTSVEITQSGVRVLAGGGDGLLSKVFEIAQGYQLRDISMTEPSLETVFILLTGRNLRD
ncbi:MAG: daunorubicin ABC transporter ATP-binding protein [Acidobacteria bacterium]|nr:MAG: daunorubicin ABC transporter ATP-binding protein [Acidobacteriota bacterium]